MNTQQSILIIGVNLLLFVFVWHFALLPLRRKILIAELGIIGLKLVESARSKGINKENAALKNTLFIIRTYQENLEQYSLSWYVSFKWHLVKNKVNMELISKEMEAFFKSGDSQFDSEILLVRRICAEKVMFQAFTSSIYSMSLVSIIFIYCLAADSLKMLVERTRKSYRKDFFSNEYRVTEMSDSNKLVFA